MIVVCDSGPFIHLSSVNHFYLLKEFFQGVEINQILYDEVVTEGKLRPGEKELKEGLAQRWAWLVKIEDLSLIDKLTQQGLSQKDASVIALALERKADILISDDPHVREAVSASRLKITGTIGILTHAKSNGFIPELKTLLDKLVDQGFRLEPQGTVYKEALKRVEEL